MMIGGRETQLMRQALEDIVVEIANNRDEDPARAETLAREYRATLDKLLLLAMLDEARRRQAAAR